MKYACIINFDRLNDFSTMKPIQICCSTWNVNNKINEIEDLSEWMGISHLGYLDLYIFGFQEMVDLNAMNVVLDDSQSIQRGAMWRTDIERNLNREGIQYKLIAAKHMVGIYIVVYAKEALVDYITDVRTSSIATGVMGIMGNKGAVSVRMNIHNTSFSFVVSHLAASRNMVNSRNLDYLTILQKLVYNQQNPELKQISIWNPIHTISARDLSIEEHDNIFWLGDLNYRIDELDYSTIIEKIEQNDLMNLLEYDQLLNEMKTNKIFHNFQEGIITFPPTYKFQPGTLLYDNRPGKKIREPAWCDRILYRNNPEHQVKQICYKRADYTMSDHLPVFALYECDVKVIDTVKERSIFVELMRSVDKWENENAPKVELSGKFIDLPMIQYKVIISLIYIFFLVIF